MTAPTPLDQDDLAARAADAGVPVEFDADHAYATIGGRVYRARLERVAVDDRDEPTLTEAECEALAPWDSESYSCACPGSCPTLPCYNDRDDLTATVKRIIAGRTALVRTAMAEARATRPGTSTEDWQTLDGREKHGYRRGMAEALDRVGAALRGDA